MKYIIGLICSRQNAAKSEKAFPAERFTSWKHHRQAFPRLRALAMDNPQNTNSTLTSKPADHPRPPLPSLPPSSQQTPTQRTWLSPSQRPAVAHQPPEVGGCARGAQLTHCLCRCPRGRPQGRAAQCPEGNERKETSWGSVLAPP